MFDVNGRAYAQGMGAPKRDEPPGEGQQALAAVGTRVEIGAGVADGAIPLGRVTAVEVLPLAEEAPIRLLEYAVIGKSGTLAQGSTPIVVAWDYNALSWRNVPAESGPAETPRRRRQAKGI